MQEEMKGNSRSTGKDHSESEKSQRGEFMT